MKVLSSNLGFKRVFAGVLVLAYMGCGPKAQNPENKQEKNEDRQENQEKKDENLNLTYEGTGEYRGYHQVNEILKNRLLDPDKNFYDFSLADYLEKKEFQNAEEASLAEFFPGLKDLLGTYEGEGLNSGFRNGQPNSINMLLWYVALSGLASDMAQICQEGGDDGVLSEQSDANLHLNTRSLDVLGQFCGSLADPESIPIETLEKFWTLLMAYDAPISEYEAWAFYVTESAKRKPSSQEFVTDAVLAALYNPYFLLKH